MPTDSDKTKKGGINVTSELSHLISNFWNIIEVVISPIKIRKITINVKITNPRIDYFNVSPPAIYMISRDRIPLQPLETHGSRGINTATPHFSSFNPLTIPKVYGRNYTKGFGSKLKTLFIKVRNQIQTLNQTRGELDVFDLALSSLYPRSDYKYDAFLDFPDGKTLYPYQQSGVAFLIQQRNALLADEMGLGKSIQAIIATRLLFKTNTIKNCLIVCPKSVLTDWENKFMEWAKELTLCSVSGPASVRRKLWMKNREVYLVTYDTLREDIAANSSIMRAKMDLVILDEVQRIKNPSTQIFKIVNKLGGAIRWGLSGTPLENRVEDLITIFSYLKPGLFHRTEVHDPMLVRAKVQPFTLRRTKSAVLKDLPEKVHNRILLDLTPRQRRVYRQTERNGITALKSKGSKATVTHVLALISRLKQICNFEPVSGESSKLEYLQDMLLNLFDTGDKMIVFSQYPTKTLKLVERQLKIFQPLFYHGALTQRERETVLQQFKEDQKVKVLLVSLKAGGLGLTLTSANYVTHFDSWWNPAVMIQAEDRTHRIGQTRDVVVTSLITKGTVEERIQQILVEKQKLFHEVVGDISKYQLTNVLTEKELFAVFGLRKEKTQRARVG